MLSNSFGAAEIASWAWAWDSGCRRLEILGLDVHEGLCPGYHSKILNSDLQQTIEKRHNMPGVRKDSIFTLNPEP